MAKVKGPISAMIIRYRLAMMTITETDMLSRKNIIPDRTVAVPRFIFSLILKKDFVILFPSFFRKRTTPPSSSFTSKLSVSSSCPNSEWHISSARSRKSCLKVSVEPPTASAIRTL